MITNLFPKPLALWVSLPRNDAELARAAAEAGADVLKVHIAVGHQASGNVFGTLEEERPRLEAIIRAAGDKPVGLVTGGSPEVAPRDLEELAKMGIAFADMYDIHMPAAWLGGRAPFPLMAAAQAGTPLAVLQDLAATGIDMLEVSVIPPDGYGQPLTVADLALYRHVRRQVSLPLVIPSQRKITPEDIPALAATGVDAVMIGAVVTGETAESIYAATAAFREAIDAL